MPAKVINPARLPLGRGVHPGLFYMKMIVIWVVDVRSPNGILIDTSNYYQLIGSPVREDNKRPEGSQGSRRNLPERGRRMGRRMKGDFRGTSIRGTVQLMSL